MISQARRRQASLPIEVFKVKVRVGDLVMVNNSSNKDGNEL